MIKSSDLIKVLYILLAIEFLSMIGSFVFIQDGLTSVFSFMVFFAFMAITIRILMHLQYYEQQKKIKSQEDALKQSMAVSSTVTGLR